MQKQEFDFLTNPKYKIIYNKEFDYETLFEEKKIENLVVTAKMNNPVNTRTFYNKFSDWGPQNNDKRFAALIFRITDPRRALLIFNSGQIVCTGAKREHEAIFLIKNFIEEIYLRKIRYDIELINIKLENVVASYHIGKKLNLEEIANDLQADVTYAPEKFPGLILLKNEFGKMKILFFKSGKVIIVGAKQKEDIKVAESFIQEISEKYTIKNNENFKKIKI